MKRRVQYFLAAAVFLFACDASWVKAAPSPKQIVVIPSDMDEVEGLLNKRGITKKLNGAASLVEEGPGNISFISRRQGFTAQTSFMKGSSTIEKQVYLSVGKERDEQARLRFVYDNQQQSLKQFMYHQLGVPMQVYDGGSDIFVYAQAAAGETDVETKEWIYARRPNAVDGSRYRWKVSSEDFYRRIALSASPDGSIVLERQIVIQGIDPLDYAKQRRVIASIHKVFKGEFKISGEDKLASLAPVFYTTREGHYKKARMMLVNRNEWEITINEPASSYPLFIESN